MMTAATKTVVIGVGNIFRGDDGAGPSAARLVAAADIPGLRIKDHIGDGTDIISAWTDADAAIIVDCMRSGASPGTVRFFDALGEEISEKLFPGYSTHSFSISDTILLARTLDQLPRLLMIIGIEGKEFAQGTGLSPEVKAAVTEVSEIIGEMVKDRVIDFRKLSGA